MDTTQRYVKLTADMLTRAFCAAGLADDTSPIQFAAPGIHRDGPGWVATVMQPVRPDTDDLQDWRLRLATALGVPDQRVRPRARPGGLLELRVNDLPDGPPKPQANSLTGGHTGAGEDRSAADGAQPGAGLHPVVIVIDEVHEMFDPDA